MSDAGLHRSSSGATPPAQTSRNSSRARNDLPEAVSSLEPHVPASGVCPPCDSPRPRRCGLPMCVRTEWGAGTAGVIGE